MVLSFHCAAIVFLLKQGGGVTIDVIYSISLVESIDCVYRNCSVKICTRVFIPNFKYTSMKTTVVYIPPPCDFSVVADEWLGNDFPPLST
jgi:hypothetical protein